jgi:hypothetical protein
VVKLRLLRMKILAPRKLAGARSDMPEGELTAIVKVSEDGYVPEGITRRAQIADRIFTAELSSEQLRQLDDDPRVVSVEPSERLGTSD